MGGRTPPEGHRTWRLRTERGAQGTEGTAKGQRGAGSRQRKSLWGLAMWGLGVELGKEGHGLPFSWPHLQEGSLVGGVEGVQWLLQPPLFREGPSTWA